MKISIGIVASERNNFSWFFIESLLRLKSYLGKDAIVSCVQAGTIPDARNAVLDIAKQHNCDYALMIDSDMTFPPNGVDILIDKMRTFEASIACGIYFGTYPPFASKPMAYDEKDGVQVALDSWKETRYITSCGMGFTLIDKSLFDLRFIFKPLTGEDHLFCKEARMLGHKIILEPSVKCGHLRTIPIDEDIATKIWK